MAEYNPPGYIYIKIGFAVAFFCSWSVSHSIPIAFLHGCLGWFYVIYYLIAH